MCPSGVTCLPTHLFSLLDNNTFISEGGMGAWDFLCLSVENPPPPPPPPSVVKWLVLYVLLNILNTMLRGAIP